MNYAARCRIKSLLCFLWGVSFLILGMFLGDMLFFLLNYVIYCLSMFLILLYGYDANVWLQEQEEKENAIKAEETHRWLREIRAQQEEEAAR